MHNMMRFGITLKILSAVFITAVVIVCGMLFLVQWSFDRGFLEYVNRIEQETHQNLVNILAEEYQAHGNWEFVTEDHRYWRELRLRSFLQSEAGRERLGPDIVKRRHGRRHGLAGGILKSRTALLDGNKQVLTGRIKPDAKTPGNKTRNGKINYLPIITAGETVGFLGVRPRAVLSDVHDLRFSRHLARTFMFIAALMLLVSLALALPLSRRLVKPIKELTHGTRELTSGNYDVEINRRNNDELGELSRNFNILAQTLKSNEAARQQWVADISHELRTPISILRGEIEALQDGVREYSGARVKALHQEVINLGRLVDDLYDLSMSDAGALDYRKENLSIQSVVKDCLNRFSGRFAQKNIDVTYHDNPAGKGIVFADGNRLRQLFTNLLNNSLHYTDANGSLMIALAAEPERISIVLEDSAPAVATEELPRLFERLYRVEASRNRATGGTGLGLAICKNIVEAHDGSITATLSDAGGLKILVELPASNYHDKN